jgi:hypothetical protein
MSATQPDYFNAYRSLKLTRDAAGVLVAAFHTRGCTGAVGILRR